MITDPRELENAIQNAFDATATDKQLRALRETLKSDPAARELYYGHAGLRQALSHRFSSSDSSQVPHLLVNASLRAQTRRSATAALLAAAAVVVLGAVLLRIILVPAPKPMAVLESASGSVLTVTHAAKGKEPAAGELAGDSSVTLSQGAVELKLRHGSRAVILAPATFIQRSDRSLHLSRGTAWFHIEQQDRGFEVVTPELRVTDLGTCFGVVTSPAASDEVHVFKGRVSASGRNPLYPGETLVAGQSRGVAPDGRLQSIASRPEAFLVRLPEAASDGLLVNGGFESGNLPSGLTYGMPASPSWLPGWRFGREIAVLKASSEVRMGTKGSINNRHPLHFGRTPAEGTGEPLYLNGHLDDVAIWNKQLSQAEIDALWNRGTGGAAAGVSRDALVANWTFDDGLADRAGLKNATAFGDARHQTAVSKIGAGAAVFDGDGDYLTAGSRGDFAIGTGSLSVAFWFRVEDGAKAISKRLLATGAGLDNHSGWAFFMDTAPDRIGAAVSDGTGRTVLKTDADTTIDPFDGDWHLAVAVFDAGTATVTTYLDSIRETKRAPELLSGGAVGVNALTIFSSTADAQVGFHAGNQGRPDPEAAVSYQSFRTEPGRNYEVEFEMGGIFFRNAEVELTASVHNGVGARGELLARHIERRSRQAGNGYNPPATFQFTASSTSTTLAFTETSADSMDVDPILDNILVRALDDGG
jgi:ferric-dicitrate binding protein FerR (iron transport regulator)